MIIIASFFQPWLGIYGLGAVMVSNLLAWALGFNKKEIESGIFGINSLLTSLALAGPYQSSEHLIILLMIACIFNVFLTVTLNGIFARFGVPSLSFPFLICLWIMLLASRSYDALAFSEGNIFLINELYTYGGNTLIKWYNTFSSFKLPEFIDIYFKSLGAIIFEYNLVAGILVAIGLIIHSRISFLISLIGFATGYFYYKWFEGDFTQIQYSYIGFNFILCSIAIGGFFFIANKRSILFAIIITPIVGVLIAALSSIFAILQLPIYSLPFILVVIMVLYLAHFFDPKDPFLKKVIHQKFSPEENLYNFQNYMLRFGEKAIVPLSLPFYGKWKVSQAYNGNITHKGDWQHALDFVIENEDGHTYKTEGKTLDDFYCYKLPILAPANGTITEVINHIEDNEVGEVNMENNWGNTVVIQIGEHLYVQLSHLLKDSILVQKGAYVQKGNIIGYLGNSGRSPEPHLHFQVQANPYIGSKTISFPLSNYLIDNQEGIQLTQNNVPSKDDWTENIPVNNMMQEAFNWIPGKKFKIKIENQFEEWEIHTDAYNQSYIYCSNDESIAYFKVENGLLYFTSFDGNKDGFLFLFHLAMHKLTLCHYEGFKTKDSIPKHHIKQSILNKLNDFVAPFSTIPTYQFESNTSNYNEMDSKVEVHSNIFLNQDELYLSSTSFIEDSRILQIDIEILKKNISAQFIYE